MAHWSFIVRFYNWIWNKRLDSHTPLGGLSVLVWVTEEMQEEWDTCAPWCTVSRGSSDKWQLCLICSLIDPAAAVVKSPAQVPGNKASLSILAYPVWKSILGLCLTALLHLIEFLSSAKTCGAGRNCSERSWRWCCASCAKVVHAAASGSSPTAASLPHSLTHTPVCHTASSNASNASRPPPYHLACLE